MKISFYDDPRPGVDRKMHSAEIVADTVGKHNGVRLTTMALTYPRYIHAQMMTHRVFSRNAQSSRAVPVSVSIQRVSDNPVVPIYWGANQRGMVADGQVGPEQRIQAEQVWNEACDHAINAASALADLGIHKQITNRLLEPFSTITAIYTSTEWENFFKLRMEDDAQPEIMDLAKDMHLIMTQSDPVVSEYHLPYIRRDEYIEVDGRFSYLQGISSSRCARVSYLTHEGKRDVERDEQLSKDLEMDCHWSPWEHPAANSSSRDFRANYRGWASARYIKGF